MSVKATKEVAPPVASNGLARFVYYISKGLDPLIIIGGAVGCVMLLGMMFLTFFDVFGRFALNKPIIGSYEITELMMVLLVTFGIAYCALKKGHIRVDIVMQFISQKANQWFNIFAYLFSTIFFVFVAWQGWNNAWNQVSSDSVSVILMIPNYPFGFLLVAGAGFVTLVFFRDFLNSIAEVIE